MIQVAAYFIEFQELVFEYNLSKWALISCVLGQTYLWLNILYPNLMSWMILVKSSLLWITMFHNWPEVVPMILYD